LKKVPLAGGPSSRSVFCSRAPSSSRRRRRRPTSPPRRIGAGRHPTGPVAGRESHRHQPSGHRSCLRQWTSRPVPVPRQSPGSGSGRRHPWAPAGGRRSRPRRRRRQPPGGQGRGRVRRGPASLGTEVRSAAGPVRWHPPAVGGRPAVGFERPFGLAVRVERRRKARRR
jgi:hypothetical protein